MPHYKRPNLKEQRRELAVCIGLLALFGCVFIAGWLWSTLHTAPEITPMRTAAKMEGDLRTGAVLFVPVAGNVCRQRLIDNETWRIRDGGHVICDEAVSWNATVPLNTYSVTTRVQALRTVFTARRSPR